MCLMCINTCRDWLLQSVVSVVIVPLSVSRSNQTVANVHIQPLRLGVKHRYQDALQNPKEVCNILSDAMDA